MNDIIMAEKLDDNMTPYMTPYVSRHTCANLGGGM